MNPTFWKRMQGMPDKEKKRIAREYRLRRLVNQILREMAERRSETNNVSLTSAVDNKEDACGQL